jgi:hypothetical protein
VSVIPGCMVTSALLLPKSTSTSATPGIVERAARTLAEQLDPQVMPVTAR